MSSQQPTASLTGQQEWEWNQLQAKQETQEIPATSMAPRSDHAGGTGTRRGSQDRRTGPRRDNTDLEVKLERKERRLQQVVTRYERLLDEKNKQLAASDHSTSTDQRWLPILSAIRQYLGNNWTSTSRR